MRGGQRRHGCRGSWTGAIETGETRNKRRELRSIGGCWQQEVAPDSEGAWAYGKGWPWNPSIFTWARHVLPSYVLRVGHPCRWPACRAGDLRLSSTPLDTPRHTPMRGRTHYVDRYHPCHLIFITRRKGNDPHHLTCTLSSVTLISEV
jgi:hypothetical protein